MENNNGYNRAIKLVRYGDPITVMVLLNQLNLGPGSLHHKYGLSCVYWINSGQFAVSKWSIAIFTITQNESQPPTSSDLNYCLNIHLFDSTSSCESIPIVEQPVSPEGSSATLKDTPEFLQSNECLSLLIFLSSPSKLLTSAQPSPAQAIIIITVPHCPCDTGAVVRALLIKIPGVPSPCYAVCDISHWDAAASCQVSQQNLLTQHTQARFIFNNKVFAFDPGIKWLVTVNMWFISLKYQVITRSTLYKGLVSCESSLLLIRFTFKILFLHHFSTLHG